jgi:hypothetical protein
MGVVRLGHPWPKKKKIEEAGFGHPQWPKLPSIFFFFFFSLSLAMGGGGSATPMVDPSYFFFFLF